MGWIYVLFHLNDAKENAYDNKRIYPTPDPEL